MFGALFPSYVDASCTTLARLKDRERHHFIGEQRPKLRKYLIGESCFAREGIIPFGALQDTEKSQVWGLPFSIY